jgi:hypothetical protein
MGGGSAAQGLKAELLPKSVPMYSPYPDLINEKRLTNALGI